MKKPSPKLTYTDAMETLLQAIDAAPIASDHPIFKKQDDKEFYETQLMFSYRKQQAAQHHIDNISTMLKTAKADATKRAKAAAAKKHPENVVTSSASMTWSSEAYIHELSAFLAAIRSGLDFLAIAAGRTMKGIVNPSMHTLEGLEPKPHHGLVIHVVKAHAAWLKELREYRDEVVHRLVVQAPVSGWLVSGKGKTSTVIIPVVVPQATPKRGYDTRRSRTMESDLPVGLSRSEWHASDTYDDGTTENIEHKICYEPADGYILIAKFMAHHIAEYRKFSAEMFAAIAASGFGSVL
ncbi:hypothetical protein V5F77_19490 [Xanthobacter sp. DSM 24535]|uniref:hypothetical protein n=1 Tax=Roseixanthobacter psychrophilus TaxID=3119917 RepID=UPI00372799A5